MNFLQKIAAKYVVIKLISRAPGSSSYDANLDMFPLHFYGIKLPVPSDSTESSELPEFQNWLKDGMYADNAKQGLSDKDSIPLSKGNGSPKYHNLKQI